MKYKYETDNELEAKQIMKYKDCIAALYEIRELFYRKDEPVTIEMITNILDENFINLEELWS